MPGVEQLTFIDLSLYSVLFLFVLGFIGGLVSGFIGSGGAFVLTPGMMTLGAPGAVAVASNMCHKFPKAMVGAYKRYKYGQVDLKLGVIMAISAAVGVLVGIKIQTFILKAWGEAGSNLYISLAFVVVLVVVGGYVFKDALKLKKTGKEAGTTKLDMVRPYITEENKDEYLAMAQTLSKSDLIAQLKDNHDDYEEPPHKYHYKDLVLEFKHRVGAHNIPLNATVHMKEATVTRTKNKIKIEGELTDD